MAAVKQILFAIATLAVIYFNPFLAIGGFFHLAGFLAYAVGAAIVGVGFQVLAGALFGQSKGATLDAGKVNVRVSEPLRWLNAGPMRQGGAVLFAEFDTSGNLWFVVVHSDSILTSTIKYYGDDIELTLDGSGNVTTNDFCLTDKGDPYTGSGTKVTYFNIQTTTYSETDPTPPAIAALHTAFPTKWTSDHKLVGTTFSVVKCKAIKIEDRYKVYRWRGPLGLGEPAIGLVGNWSNAYDPRDMTQTLGDRSTYKYSGGNPVLIWAWLRTHRYGRNKLEASINWAKVAEQATLCDDDITGIVGTHKRYRCGTAIPDNKERNIAEQEILASCDAQLVFDDDGKCWPRVGYYVAPTLHLSRNRDIVAMSSVEAQNGESETQGVIVRYMSPDAKYTAQPSAAWLNPLYYVPGEAALFLTVDILTIQDHNQAMRIAKAIGERSQPAYKILPTVGIRGLRARQERIIDITYDNTFAGEHEIVTAVEVDQTGAFCGFGLTPIGPNHWTLLAGEEKPAPVVTDSAGAVVIPDAPTVDTVTYNNGRIEITFDAPTRVDVTYQFQYIKTADISGAIWLDMTVLMDTLFAYSGTIVTNTSYTVRWRTITSAGVPDAWSSGVTITGVGPAADPTDVSATSATTVTGVKVSWRSPQTAFDHINILKNTVNDPTTATIIGTKKDALGQVDSLEVALAVGTYYFWVDAVNSLGVAGTPVPTGSTTITPPGGMLYITSTLGL